MTWINKYLKATDHPSAKKQFAITLTRVSVVTTSRTLLVEGTTKEEVECAIANLDEQKEIDLLRYPTEFVHDISHKWGDAELVEVDYPTLPTHVAVESGLFPKGLHGSNK